MKIFFDFDDVLFDTRRFKEDYFRIFEKHGVSRKIFDECYYEPLSKEKIKNYNPENHIRRVCKKTGIKLSVFEKEIGIFLQDTSEYVFEEVDEALKNFKRDELAIISFSKTEFQKAKIFRSGIVKLFCEVEIVNVLKGEAISKMIKEGKLSLKQEIFFIDDRAEQLRSVKGICPQVVTILCDRKEGRYHDRKNKLCDYRIRKLGELEKIIYA